MKKYYYTLTLKNVKKIYVIPDKMLFMYKKLIFCVFILLLSVSFVSAEDNITDGDNEIIHVDGEDFSSIENTISRSNQSSMIELNGTYTSNNNQIYVNKDITIQGSKEGAILDAKDEEKDIFYFNGCNVTLKNLKFINVPEYYTAINAGSNTNVIIINCSFENVDTAISTTGSSLQIDKCHFNNIGRYSIYSNTGNTYVNSSIFTDHDWGIFSNDYKLTVENSIFKNAEWSNIEIDGANEVYLRKNQFLKSAEDTYSAKKYIQLNQ